MRLILIFLFAVVSFARIYTQANLDTLASLDVEIRFINNKKLNKIYNYYNYYKKQHYLDILKRGRDYLPLIKEAIYKAKLPEAILSVAIIESYLSKHARSNKRAIGLWQFIPLTARKYGLKIDEYVDERKDPIKSTETAIKYFKYLHKFFNNWYLAIMAYNAGEARIIEGVVRAKVDKICEAMGKECRKDKEIKKYRKIIKDYQRRGSRAFYSLYLLYKELMPINITLNDLLRFQKGLSRQYIPKETREYILKIIALTFLLHQKSFEKYLDVRIQSGVSAKLTPVNVPPGTSLWYVSKIIDVPFNILRRENLHLRYIFSPPYPYYIYIPSNRFYFFQKKFRAKRYFLIYKVKKGDTLLKIAKKYNIKLKLIEDFNKLSRYLHINQKIVIPLNHFYIKYRVKKGDSLNSIAKKFNTTYKEIMKANSLKNSIIRIGQILKIPQKFKDR